MKIYVVFSPPKTASTTLFESILRSMPPGSCAVHTHCLRNMFIYNPGEVVSRLGDAGIGNTIYDRWIEDKKRPFLRIDGGHSLVDVINKNDIVRVVCCVRDPLRRRISQFSNDLNITNCLDGKEERPSRETAGSYFRSILGVPLQHTDPPVIKAIKRSQGLLDDAKLCELFKSVYSCEQPTEYTYIFERLGSLFGYSPNPEAISNNGWDASDNVFLSKTECLDRCVGALSSFLGFELLIEHDYRNSLCMPNTFYVCKSPIKDAIQMLKSMNAQSLRSMYESPAIKMLGYEPPD